jgi:hypothetical protein
MDNMSDNQFFLDPHTSAIAHGMKRCAQRGCIKPLSEFNNRRDSKDGKQSYCRDCQSSYQLTYKYDLSQEAFDAMFREQAGLCFLCHKTCEQYTKLSVDHCNILGVRKLLCMRCIGFQQSFAYNPVVIRRAVAYLRTPVKLYRVRVAVEELWEEADIKTTLYITRDGLTYKWCPKCQRYQSADAHFYTFHDPSGHIVSHSWCIACCKDYGLEIRYGINNATKEHWELLQEHCCWICEEKRPLCVDHDHREPRSIRGLLCHPCNTGLGFYQDDTALMERAAQYLESYSLPFLARFLPFEDAMREEVDQGGEGDQGLLV